MQARVISIKSVGVSRSYPALFSWAPDKSECRYLQWPYHITNTKPFNALPSAIQLLSNPRFLINARAKGKGINWNSRVANQLNNLTSGIKYYLVYRQCI